MGLSAGLVAGLNGRAMAGVSAEWNPGDLTGLAATLLPAESLAGGLLWQNTAKTVPAVADGDPVRVAVCPYTAVEFTAPSDAARPLLWEEGGGLWSLAFDGIDDRLSRAAILPTGTGLTLISRATADWTGSRVLVGQRWNDEGTSLLLSGGVMQFRASNVSSSFFVAAPGTPAGGEWATVDGVADLSTISAQSTGARTSTAMAFDPYGPGASFAVGAMVVSGGGSAIQFWSGRVSGVIVSTMPAETTSLTSARDYMTATKP